MKKINILESLKKIDKDTFSEYDLSTLYESHKWSEDQKKQLVRYISSYKDPSFIGQYMAECQDCKNITESDDDDISDLKFIDMSKEAYLHGGDDYGFDEYDIIDHYDDLEDGYDDEELASGFGGDRNTCPKCGGSNYHDGHCYDCEPDYVPSEIDEAFDKEGLQNIDLHDGILISDSKEIKTDKGVFTRFGNHWEYKPNTGKVGFSLSDKELEYQLKNHKILHIEEAVDTEDKPYTYRQIFDELKSLTRNFTVKSDTLKCGFKEEADFSQNILSQYYASVKVDKVGSWFQVDFKDLKKGKKVNEVYDVDDPRKDGTNDTLANDVAWFAEYFEYNGSPVFDSDYTRARYVTNGDVSLQLQMNGALGSFSDEQKESMDKELNAFLDALAENGYTVKGSPKVNDRYYLVSNGRYKVYRYVTIRIVNDGSRIINSNNI